MSNKPERSLVGIRLKHADRAKLQAIADAQHRPLSNLIAAIALDFLKYQQSKTPRPLNGHDKTAVAKSASPV